MLGSKAVLEVVGLWDEVSDWNPLEPEAVMTRAMESIMPLIGATRAVWMGSARNKDYTTVPAVEMFDDWFVIAMLKAEAAGYDSVKTEDSYRLYMEARVKNPTEEDCLTAGALVGAGASRARLRSESLDDAAWQEHWIYKDFNKLIGIGDALHCVFSVDADCESWLVFYKEDGEPYFEEKDKLLAHMANVGLADWHRRMMRLRGAALPSRRLLSERERSVLKFLLLGLREKEIAEELEVSAATIRRQAVSIYQKLAITGRSELAKGVCF